MGECGCSEGIVIGTFQGPNKSIYVLHLYPGCRDCDASPGVFIRKYKNKIVAEDLGIDNYTPKLNFIDPSDPGADPKTAEITECSTVFIDNKILINNLLNNFGEALLPPVEDKLTLKEYLTNVEPEEIYHIMRNTVFDSLNNKD